MTLPPSGRARELLATRAELRAAAGRCREALVDFDALLTDEGRADLVAERALRPRRVPRKERRRRRRARRSRELLGTVSGRALRRAGSRGAGSVKGYSRTRHGGTWR